MIKIYPKFIQNLSKNRKAVSIIILCLMILGTLPLYSASAGTGEDSASTGTEKSAKTPKSPDPGGELSELTNGTGANNTDRFGWNVSYAGDINGDGIDDIVVGAPYNDSADGLVTDCGAVYIFFGYSGIALGNLTATYANVSIYGTATNGHFGWSVSDAGDVNQTSGGIGDIIIGEPGNGNEKAYIFFGRATADWLSSYTTADANVTLTLGSSGDKFGSAVSGAGDVNNDSYDDVIIGAYANSSDKGKAYIFYGGSAGPSQINYTACTENYNITGTTTDFPKMQSWTDSEAYATLTEATPSGGGEKITNGNFDSNIDSWTVADLTGDMTDGGSEGIFWYSTDACARGRVYDRNSAGTGNFYQEFSVDTLPVDSASLSFDWRKFAEAVASVTHTITVELIKPDTTTAYTWSDTATMAAGTGSWTTKSAGVTIDATGTWKIKISFNLKSGNNANAACGADFDNIGLTLSYANMTEIQVNTTNIPSGKSSYTLEIYGNISDEMVNISVYNGTDWNIRGNISSATMTLFTYTLLSGEIISNEVKVKFIDENRTGDATQSSAYIDYLRVKAVGADVTLTGENDNDKFGYSVSGAGNVSGDSYDDVIVGAPWNDTGGADAGAAYIFYGNDSMSSNIYASDANVTLTGESTGDNFGFSVSNLSDVNNDGYDDYAVGAPGYSSSKGRAYIYYGGPSSVVGSITNDTDTEFNTYSEKLNVTVMPAVSEVSAWDGRVNLTSSDQFYDDFEVDLSKWTLYQTGGAITRSTAYSIYGSYSAELLDSSGTDIVQMQSTEWTAVTKGMVEYYARTNGDGLGIWLAGYSAPNWYSTCVLGFNQSKIQWMGSGLTWYDIMPYSPNTWYHIMILYDNSAHTWDIYINDTAGKMVLRKEGATYYNNLDSRRIYIDTGAGPNSYTLTAYVDEIRASRFPNTPGYIQSATTTFAENIQGVKPVWNATVPSGTTLTVNVSRDGGTTWSPALTNGTVYEFTNGEPEGNQLKFNVTFTTDGDYTAILYDIKIEVVKFKVILTGATAGDQFGYSVSGAGDINNDGYNETAVGAPFNSSLDGTVTSCGAVYVFNGSSSMSSSISASDANYTNYGENTYDNFTWSVSYAGDLNNDGYKDIIVGAPHYGSNDNGKAYVLTCKKPVPKYTTLTVSGVSKAPEFATIGNTNITMLNLTLSSDDGDDKTVKVTSINISLTGTGTSTNISGVTIYNDTDGSGGLSAGDTQLNTTQIFSDGYVLFGNLNFDVNYGCNAYIFVVYNISSTATIDVTVGANITNETKIIVDTTNDDVVAGFSTIWSNNSTIKDKITYEIRNETGVLQTGDWKVWGNWTADPGEVKVNGTNWLRIRNTNCSKNDQQVIVDFTGITFENATTGGSIPIDGNIWFWYFYTNFSSETPDHWINTENNATTGVNETADGVTDGAYTFTFNKVGEYIWILYRIENMPEICPDGNYTATFTVQVPP